MFECIPLDFKMSSFCWRDRRLRVLETETNLDYVQLQSNWWLMTQLT